MLFRPEREDVGGKPPLLQSRRGPLLLLVSRGEKGRPREEQMEKGVCANMTRGPGDGGQMGMGLSEPEAEEMPAQVQGRGGC